MVEGFTDSGASICFRSTAKGGLGPKGSRGSGARAQDAAEIEPCLANTMGIIAVTRSLQGGPSLSLALFPSNNKISRLG